MSSTSYVENLIVSDLTFLLRPLGGGAGAKHR